MAGQNDEWSGGIPAEGEQKSYTCLACGKEAFPTGKGTDVLDPDAAHIRYLADDDGEEQVTICYECTQTDDWEKRARTRRDTTGATSPGPAGIIDRLKRPVEALLGVSRTETAADVGDVSSDEQSEPNTSSGKNSSGNSNRSGSGRPTSNGNSKPPKTVA